MNGSEPVSSAAPLITAEGVTKRFGTFVAVAEASLTVARGEVVGLLGANGAGKTTLLRMVLGMTTPTAGRVRLGGRPPDRRSRRTLGYVPQGLGLYRDLTARENMQFAATLHGVPTGPLPEEIADAGDGLVRDLPLGVLRRLAFACALVHRPDLLILDEPTSGVDPLARARLWDTIRDQADRGVGVLVTTHYMQEAEQCDRLVLMSRGRVVATGGLADIIGDTTAVLVRTDDWSTAFDVLSAAGLPVALVGTGVRVADTPAAAVAAVLAAAGLRGRVEAVPATLDERMVTLGRDGSGGGP